MMQATAMYTDIVVIFDQYGCLIVKYDDLQQIRYTLTKGLDLENDDVIASSSILFGFLSFNEQSNQYIKAIISLYTHMTDGYAALYATMHQTTSWLYNERLNWTDIPFTNDIDPSHYATTIINSTKAALKSESTEYNTTEQSREMLYQIM